MDKSFFKHATAYGLAFLLVRAAAVILLPIYTRILSETDYGVLDVVERLAETVGTCLLFGGFRQALLTFYSQADPGRARREVVSTALGLVLVASLVGGLFALSMSPALLRLMAWLTETKVPPVGSRLVRLALLGILLEPFSLIPLTLVQARQESATYVVVALSQFLFRVCLCIFLVRFLHWGVEGALAASVAHGVVFGLALCAWELARGAALPTPRLAVRMITFALPMLPGGLCFFLLHHGDRLFLMHWCPMEDIAHYGLGYKLALTVPLFSLNPLYMVWGARMYAAAARPDARLVFGRVCTRILAVYAVVGLALCLFAGEVVHLLAAPGYAGAAAVVPPVVLAGFFQAAASMMDSGFYVKRRTGLKMVVTLASTAVMVALYVLWIPVWGIHGAALATLGGFVFLAGATWATTQRIFPVRYEWPRLAALLALAVGAWSAGSLLPPAWWAVPVKSALLALLPLACWYTGLVSPEEKHLVRGHAVPLAARFRRSRPAPVVREESREPECVGTP